VQADIEAERTEDEPRNLQRVPVIEVISETDEEPAETITAVDTAVESAPDAVDEAAPVEVKPDAADTSELAAPNEPMSKDESEAASSAATVETTTQVASPEDDALAELRRRRLERLSTGNS
jgi:hypothetical protein